MCRPLYFFVETKTLYLQHRLEDALLKNKVRRSVVVADCLWKEESLNNGVSYRRTACGSDVHTFGPSRSSSSTTRRSSVAYAVVKRFLLPQTIGHHYTPPHFIFKECILESMLKIEWANSSKFGQLTSDRPPPLSLLNVEKEVS